MNDATILAVIVGGMFAVCGVLAVATSRMRRTRPADPETQKRMDQERHRWEDTDTERNHRLL